jgi:hypothetical protein
MTNVSVRIAPIVVVLGVLSACSPSAENGGNGGSPLSPSSAPAGMVAPTVTAFSSGPMRVPFPPQNEPVDFLMQLEARYQNQLRRPPVPTYIDPVGHAVWMADYLRYRVNLCNHADAVAKVLTRVNSQGAIDPPECGVAPSGRIPFPPQNEPVSFLTELEATYRDRLGRQSLQSYVDAVGHAVWMADYMRYRVNGCTHADSVAKVLIRVDTEGRQDPPVCTTGTSSPAPRAEIRIESDRDTVDQRIVVPGQCAVTQAGSQNRLRCTFDAGSSTPFPGITSYVWTIEGVSGTIEGRAVSPTVPCGTFSGTISTRRVSLSVTSSGGRDSTSLNVTFVRSGAC